MNINSNFFTDLRDKLLKMWYIICFGIIFEIIKNDSIDIYMFDAIMLLCHSAIKIHYFTQNFKFLWQLCMKIFEGNWA